MNVQIQSVKFDADKKLIEFVENKMSKLERFADRYHAGRRGGAIRPQLFSGKTYNLPIFYLYLPRRHF